MGNITLLRSNMRRSVMLLLSVMITNQLPNLGSFAELSVPLSEEEEEEVPNIAPPYMDYDETNDDYIDDDDDYDDYYEDSEDEPRERQDGRLRQMIKSCEFIDLTVLGGICNTGRKI